MEQALRSSLALTHKKELLDTPEPAAIDSKASKKEQLAFVEQIQKRFDEAEKITAEELPMDLRIYRICPDKEEGAELQDKAAENIRLDVQIEKNFQVLQISFQHDGGERKKEMEEIMKDIYEYYGVTEEDKEKGTERFWMLVHVLEERSDE